MKNPKTKTHLGKWEVNLTSCLIDLITIRQIRNG